MGENPTPTGVLVWEQITQWVWASECGRFKIERFITGDHELCGTGFPWPERFRVLKRTPEWYGDIGAWVSLSAAQRACEGLT
jgi:hypothetical protein